MIGLLSSDSPTVQAKAARLLAAVSGGAGNGDRGDIPAAVVEAGAVPPLLRLLQTGSAESKREAAIVVAQLMRCAAGAAAVASAEAVVVVVATLRDAYAVATLMSLLRGSCLAARTQAAWALRELAVGDGQRTTLFSQW